MVSINRSLVNYHDEHQTEDLGRLLTLAVLRTVAVTPFRTSGFDFAEVKRVCQDCTLAGFKAMYEAGPAKPFRFIYFSADGTPRDPIKRPAIMGDYQVMRVSYSCTSLSVLMLKTICFLVRNRAHGYQAS